MAAVMMKCPKTDRLVPTGINIPADFFDEMVAGGNKTQCTDCGELHAWGEAEVVLDN